MNYSITQGSNVVVFVSLAVLVLNHFGVKVSSDEVTQVVSGVAIVVATIVSWVNRYKKGDVNVAGFKKSVQP